MSKPTCSIPECSKQAFCRGWCRRHYERWRVKGSPLWQPLSDDERFWTKVAQSDECWYWQGAVDHTTGYGKFYAAGRIHGAHRWMYEMHSSSEIPAGLVIDHICHNGSGCAGGSSCMHRRCVNPDHLALATHAENISRGEASKKATHCHNGHPLDGDNLYVDPKGTRHCRICGRARTRAWYRRRGGVA